MGVRTIIGLVDGTRAGGAMYDSGSGAMLGDVWEADDAYEQIEAFQDWLRTLGPIRAVEDGKLDLATREMPSGNGADAREWPQSGLIKASAYWRKHVRSEVTA